jgi:hypothetical protein
MGMKQKIFENPIKHLPQVAGSHHVHIKANVCLTLALLREQQQAAADALL